MKTLLALSVLLLVQFPVPPMRIIPADPPPERPGFIYQPPIYVEPLPRNPWDGSRSYIVTQPGKVEQPPSYIEPDGNGGVVITQPGKSRP